MLNVSDLDQRTLEFTLVGNINLKILIDGPKNWKKLVRAIEHYQNETMEIYNNHQGVCKIIVESNKTTFYMSGNRYTSGGEMTLVLLNECCINAFKQAELITSGWLKAHL